jgi:hypothetical protein
VKEQNVTNNFWNLPLRPSRRVTGERVRCGLDRSTINKTEKKIPKTEKSFSPPAPEWAQLNPGEMAEITKRLAARDFNYSFVCSGLRCAGRRKTFPRASHKRRRNNNNFRCNAVDPSKFFFILEEIVINLDESSRSTRPNSMFFPE